MPDAPHLPILDIADQIIAALRTGNRLVLSAPTGSGKTTQVPRIIHRAALSPGRIIILQPRRLATRLMARRVADETNTPLGRLVGYQTRHESLVSDDTVICFMTEGLFLRQMQSRPTLPGVGVVILDEFHERSVALDVSLALVKTLQERTRPDLKLVVMSATLDVERVCDYLSCTALEATGRTFPVDIRHVPRRSVKPIWDQAAAALPRTATGDVLVFMPGAYEIRRTVAACRAAGAYAVALHGQMPLEEQDRALAPSTERKVIVATNVAETSITIPGITSVIDSGLARVNRYDPRRGINVLLVEPISQASADQRAGRAGRTAPGSCLRLWPENEHRSRPAHTDPEVRRLDLSEILLQLCALGWSDFRGFPWLEPPDDLALERARRLLRALEAINPDGSLTDIGRTMALLPMHPRLARMLLAAAQRHCLHRAALWAALASERDILPPAPAPAPGRGNRFTYDLGPEPASDFLVLERAIDAAAAARFTPDRCAALGVHGQACRQVVQTHRLYLNACRRAGLDDRGHAGQTDDVIRCLLTGFVDHLAVRRGEDNLSCTLLDKRRGELDQSSVVRHTQVILPLEISEIGGGKSVRTVLSLASRIDPTWLEDRTKSETIVHWNADTQQVERVERVMIGDLVLRQRVSGSPGADEAAALLADLVARRELKLQRWDEDVEQWITRTRCVARWRPERKLLTYEENDVRVIVLELCAGATRYSQIRDKPCLDAVKGALSWEDQRLVEELAPPEVKLPSGRKMKITYECPSDGPPAARGRAKIQDLYGLTRTPTVAGGSVAVRLEILGPNFRPVQVTDDLAGFWKNLYPALRRELSRKYPRHEWR